MKFNFDPRYRDKHPYRERYEDCLEEPRYIQLVFVINGIKIKGFNMETTLTSIQTVVATAQAVDAKGNVVPDTFTWSFPDATVASLSATTGASVTITAVAAGVAVLTVTDGTTLTTTATVTVTAAPAVSINLTFATPV